MAHGSEAPIYHKPEISPEMMQQFVARQASNCLELIGDDALEIVLPGDHYFLHYTFVDDFDRTIEVSFGGRGDVLGLGRDPGEFDQLRVFVKDQNDKFDAEYGGRHGLVIAHGEANPPMLSQEIPDEFQLAELGRVLFNQAERLGTIMID